MTKNFLVRLQTAILFVAVMIAGIFVHPFTYGLLFLGLLIATMNEYYNIIGKSRTINSVSKFYKFLGISIGALFFIFTFYHAYADVPLVLFSLLPVLLFSFFILELYAGSENPFQNIAVNLLGFIYIALPFSLTNYIVFFNGIFTPLLLMGFILLVWLNDTGAYLTGSRIGKTKLFPRISPGKTWEGFAGGAVAAVLTGIIYHYFTGLLTYIDWIVIALIAVVIGTAGDLIESMLKRSLNIKDSGKIMPGHGGFLDRFDAIIFALPFVLFYILMRDLI